MTKFSTFNLPEMLNNSLVRMGYDTATPIQAKAIPLAMEGRDILGSAQTGTGKTAAFSIPMINYLVQNQNKTAIVLTPTRELAVQVIDIVRQLVGPKKGIHAALLIGGAPMHGQIADLKRRPRIIVGTPGRVTDHLNRGRLHLDEAGFLVLDETDRMLDMGFGIQIDEILRHMPHKRQTLLFSATMPRAIEGVAKKYLNNPERIAIGSTTDVAKNVTQEMIRVATSDKYDMLLSQVGKRKGSMIVFVKTKRGADKLAEKLRHEDFQANAIHGDLRQRQRDRVIRLFREKKYRILVATDVAARGLDIPHIEHVINYNLPQCPEDYIHRIGRTARAGAKGEALCIVSPDENSKWNAISRMLDPNTSDDGGNEQNGRKAGGRGRGRGGNSRGGFGGNRDRNSRGGKQGGGYKGKRSFGGDRSSEGRPEKRQFGDKKRAFGGDKRRDNNNETRSERPSFNKGSGSERQFGGGNRDRNSDAPRKYVESREGGNSNRNNNFDAGKRRREEGRRARDGEQRSHDQKREWNPARSENRGNSNGGRGSSFNSENRGGNTSGERKFGDRNRSTGGAKFGDKKRSFGDKRRSNDEKRNSNVKSGRKPFGANRSRNNADGQKPVRRRNTA